MAPAQGAPPAGVALNSAAWGPVSAVLTVMGSALVLVRVTPWAGEVVPMAWAGKLSALGPADRPGARCANTLNSVVCTQSGPASAGGVQAVVGSVGLGLMPGPSIRKRLSPVGLPLTPWGVTPSERKPRGGAGAVLPRLATPAPDDSRSEGRSWPASC